MPRPSDFAPAGKLPGPRPLRFRLAGLLIAGLVLAGALLAGSRYREHQRARREAAERARWALAAAQRKTAPPAGEASARADHAPALLDALRRGVLAVAPGLSAAGSAPLAAESLALLAPLTAQPGLLWLPPILHGAAIQDASFSLDGTLLLTAGADGGVQVRQTQSGRAIAQLRLPRRAGVVQLARFSPDGARVATASADGGIQLWAVPSGQALLTAALDLPPGAIRDAEFAPDGRLLLIATATGTAYLIDSRTGATAAKLSGHRDEVTMGSFSPDGLRVVTASADGTVRLFAVATGTSLTSCKAHPLGARVARFSPDGQLVVTAGSEATVRVWDARTLTGVAELRGHHGEVLSARFSPDGTQLVTAGADHSALVWESRTGRLLASLIGHAHPLSDAVFSPDGATVLTAAVDGEARLWATPSTKLLAVLRGHRARLTALEFSSDGEQLLTASLDGAARVWTARPLATTDAERVVFHPELLAAHFSPTDELLATTGRDGAVKLWDPRDGKLRRALLGHAYPVHAAGFTPDGRRLLSVSDDGAGRIWDARSGLTLHTLLGHTYPVRSVSIAPSGLLGLTVDLAGIARLWSVRDGLALGLLSESKLGTVARAEFSPDGERLVTVTAQGTARLWNVHTLALQTSLPHGQPIRAIDFSPDGSRVLTAATDHLVQLWDTRAAGPLSAPVATLSAPGGELTVARFSPDGLRVVTAATDHTARVFDVAAQQALVTLNEHTGQVRTAAFSPDGLRVLTGDSDGLALLWEATTGKVLRRLTGRGAILAAEFSPDGQSVLLGRQEGDVRVVALSLAPLVSGACRLLRNHEAQWAQVAAVCQPVLAGTPPVAAAPSDGGSSADAGLWAPGPLPDGGVLDAPAWRREVAPRSHEIPAGCFAFSAKLHAAACRIRYRTSAARERVAVAFVPAVFPAIAVEPEVGDSVEPRCPPLVWGPALATLQARLFAGDFSPLLASAYRPLQEGSELPLGTSGAYLSWLADRRAKPPRPTGHGQSEGTLQVRCASGKRLVLHTYKSLDEQVTAAVATVPDGKRLSFRVAISTPVPATTADSAPSRADREEKVMLLDPRSCAIQTPAAPDLL